MRLPGPGHNGSFDQHHNTTEAIVFCERGHQHLFMSDAGDGFAIESFANLIDFAQDGRQSPVPGWRYTQESLLRRFDERRALRRPSTAAFASTA